MSEKRESLLSPAIVSWLKGADDPSQVNDEVEAELDSSHLPEDEDRSNRRNLFRGVSDDVDTDRFYECSTVDLMQGSSHAAATETVAGGDAVPKKSALLAGSQRKPESQDSLNFVAAATERVEEVGAVAKKSAWLAAKGVGFLTRNGQLRHATPVPPYSDVAELEYISSLHQCSNMQELRQDGSVSAQEVAAFLTSRQGLVLTAETARNVVLGGLTADKVDEDEDKTGEKVEDDEQATMDLVELTSALIIPNLLRLRRMRTEKGREGPGLQEMESKCPACREVKDEGTANANEKSDSGDEKEQQQKPGVEIFKDVLSLILSEVTGSAEPKPINEKLVRDIVLYYGEEHWARDEQLLSEMVECASGPTILLDTDAFVEGLTSDVERNYDPRREDRVSTNYQDVFCDWGDSYFTADEESGARAAEDLVHEETLGETCIEKAKKMNRNCCKRKSPETAKEGNGQIESKTHAEYTRLFTAPPIDYAADNYRTRVHGVVVWIAFVAFYVVYLLFGATAQYQSNRCAQENKDFTSAVICPFISGTVNALLIVAELIVLGTPFVSLASVGNGIDGRENAVQMIIGIVLFLAFLLVPYFARMEVPYWFSTNTNKTYRIIALLCGLVVTVLQLFNLLMVLIRRHPTYQKLYTWYYNLGNVRYESQIKKAGLFKVDQMLANALKLHSESLKLECNCEASKSKRLRSQNNNSNFGRALFEYSKLDGIMTEVGGVSFTWKRIWNRKLFTEDGIWISNRLALGTVFQIGVCCATPFVAIYGVRYVVTWVIQNQSTGDVSISPAKAGTVLALGAIGAFCTAAYMTLTFMPSMVSTTLKFRRGVIPSMRSREFLRYRFALDQVTLMYGGMFWGVLTSAVAVGTIIGTFIFLLTWQQTSSFFLSLIGNYLGLGVVIITKIVILQLLRNKFFAAFYRKSPLAANLLTLAMECYSAAISVYFMVVRAVKILVLGAMYIGRIDAPLFADGVGMFGPIELDNWPTVTRKEILLHEAHRHPYLEQLGYLYLMQLRYKDGKFATRACSAWRLVFVTALMPWLHKFRELTRPEDFGLGDDGEQINLRNTMRRTSIAMNDMRSAWLSRSTIGTRKLSSFLEDADAEKNERIAAVKAELERLQNELSELQADD